MEGAFKQLTTDEQIFKQLIWDPAVKLAETYLETYLTFLSLPVIKSIEEGIINTISDWFFKQIVLLIDVNAIKLVNGAHQNAYDVASIKLKIIAHDKGINSNEFIAARDEAKTALSKFVQFIH